MRNWYGTDEHRRQELASVEPKRGVRQILKSYFYWTYPRGCFHYDVMVTLILLFIFVTPHLWNYGDKPSSSAGLLHPIELTGDGNHGMIVTVQAADVNVPAGATDAVVKKALRAGHFAGDRRRRGGGALGDCHRRPGKC